MSEIRVGALADTAAQGPGRRLKGTCDMCAASKVRCDRQKPRCGRCDKLGLTCSYSPAQRAGRPQGKTVAGGLARARADMCARVAAPHYSHLSNDPPVQRSIQPRIAPMLNPGLDLDVSEKTQSGLDDCMSGSSAVDVPLPVQSQDLFNDDMELDTVASMLSTPSLSYGFSSADATLQGADWEFSAPDCTHTVTALQSSIELARHDLQSIARHPGHNMEYPTAHSAITAVAASFKPLSTVLICSCSGQLHVGLLIAAVCLSILDVYSSIVDELTPGQLRKHAACLLTPISHVSGSFRRKSSFRGSIDSPDENDARIQIMADLAKLATVVRQFSKRYEADNVQVESTEVLRTMALFMKTRLQAMHREIMGNLLGDD